MAKEKSGFSLKVLIANSHTSLNSGDAGILIGHVIFLRKKFECKNITVITRTPIQDREIYKDYNLTFLPPIIPTPLIFKSGTQRIKENLTNLFSIWSRFRLISEIRKSDFVVVCGGANFFSNWKFFPGPMFFQHYLHILISILFKKPIFFFPQSFGPFKNKASVFLTKVLFASKYIKKIWAREEFSYRILLNLVKRKSLAGVCPDMAFLIDLRTKELPVAQYSNLSRPAVVLTLRNWSFPNIKNRKFKLEKKELYLNAVVNTCRYITESLNGSIIFLPSSKGIKELEDDRIIIKEVLDIIGKSIPKDKIYCPVLKENESIFHIASLISSADLVLATRFHPSIFASILGIPTLSMAYHHKCSGIMKMMNLDRYCIHISKINSRELIQGVDEILKNRDSIRRDLSEAVSKIRNEIEKNLYEELYPFIFQVKKNK